MDSTSFLGFSCPSLLFVFLKLLFLRTCYIFFREYWDFLWVFIFFSCFCAPYFGLACDHGNSFLCLEGKKEKVVLDRCQNGFSMWRQRFCICRL